MFLTALLVVLLLNIPAVESNHLKTGTSVLQEFIVAKKSFNTNTMTAVIEQASSFSTANYYSGLDDFFITVRNSNITGPVYIGEKTRILFENTTFYYVDSLEIMDDAFVVIRNSTIRETNIRIYDNAVLIIENSTFFYWPEITIRNSSQLTLRYVKESAPTVVEIYAYDESNLNIYYTNLSTGLNIYASDDSFVNIYSSKINALHIGYQEGPTLYTTSKALINNSEIGYLRVTSLAVSEAYSSNISTLYVSYIINSSTASIQSNALSDSWYEPFINDSATIINYKAFTGHYFLVNSTCSVNASMGLSFTSIDSNLTISENSSIDYIVGYNSSITVNDSSLSHSLISYSSNVLMYNVAFILMFPYGYIDISAHDNSVIEMYNIECSGAFWSSISAYSGSVVKVDSMVYNGTYLHILSDTYSNVTFMNLTANVTSDAHLASSSNSTLEIKDSLFNHTGDYGSLYLSVTASSLNISDTVLNYSVVMGAELGEINLVNTSISKLASAFTGGGRFTFINTTINMTEPGYYPYGIFLGDNFSELIIIDSNLNTTVTGMSYGGFIYVEHSFLSRIELNGMNATINGSKIESLASNVFFFPTIVQIPITSFAKIIQSNISTLYYGILVFNGSLTLENGTYYSGSGIISSITPS